MNPPNENDLLLWFNGKCFCVGGHRQLLKDRKQAVLIKEFDGLQPVALKELARRLNNSNIPEGLKRLLDL